MVLSIDRAHQKIRDKSDGKQSCHQVKNPIVGARGGHAACFVRLGESIDELRSDDGGHRPGGDEAPVDGADLIASEEVAEVSRMVANPPPYIVRIRPVTMTKRVTLDLPWIHGTLKYKTAPMMK